MQNVIICGASELGQQIYGQIKSTAHVTGFLDNDRAKWGMEIDRIPVLGGTKLASTVNFDKIILASITGCFTLRSELLSAGIPPEKIDSSYVDAPYKARISFLKDYAGLVCDVFSGGCVAECGVFQGDFAKEINACFPTRKLYLFDTFEGFDAKDVEVEQENQFSNEAAGHLNMTSAELVLQKLPHPNSVIIKKGYFPQTTTGVEQEKFIFVNIDFDLYRPTLAALDFFYPRMVSKSVMLIHDYFNSAFLGVKQAVKDFELKLGYELYKLPIGDCYSIAIVKE